MNDLFNENKCSERIDKDICKIENENIIMKYLDEKLSNLIINLDYIDNSILSWNCFSCYESFLEAPIGSKLLI